MTDFFNTGLTQQQFLDRYWQKRPLVIRGAFKQPVADFKVDDFAGLATESAVESRLIQQVADNRWTLLNGPFSAETFANLPETAWTILIQDVDKHFPELQTLFNGFRFIPDWRREDLMISYAVPGGSVGPHTDSYDVFLLQSEGIRDWHISAMAETLPQWQQDSELRVLAEFEADHYWSLQPGDMLYLPPHFAHYGIAKTACLTFSIGFRAPSEAQLMDALVNTLLEAQLGDARYSDADLTVASHSSQIDQQAIARCKKLLYQTIESADATLIQAIGQVVTESKSNLLDLAESVEPSMLDADDLAAQFEQGQRLIRNAYLRFAWYADAETAYCFVGGERYIASADSASLLPVLCETAVLDMTHWQHVKTDEALVNLLIELLAAGAFYWAEEDD